MSRALSPSLKLDTGIQVRLGRQIAEGGFSYVFEATGEDGKKYALKRIHIADNDALQECKREASVHRALRHPNLMPVLGTCHKDPVFYMLFPFMPQSLRSTVNKQVFETEPAQKPFEEQQVLHVFHQVLSAVAAMHRTNFSHRDIKLENILLRDAHTPVLMDFGSAGPLLQPLRTRKDVLESAELASQHTTLPYRPPELLEGSLRAGDHDLDYAKVDVWSLGCTLFAMMFGASPFECEFRSHSGEIRIVDCTPLRILGSPSIPPVKTDVGRWYSDELVGIVKSMLTLDRMLRPTIAVVTARVEKLIQSKGGRLPKSAPQRNDGDLDDLLGSNRSFV